MSHSAKLSYYVNDKYFSKRFSEKIFSREHSKRFMYLFKKYTIEANFMPLLFVVSEEKYNS